MQVVKRVLYGEIVPIAWLWHRFCEISVFNSNDVGIENFRQLFLISFSECVMGIIAFSNKDGRTVEPYVAYYKPLVECAR